jgi:hypothetical protein
MMRVWGGDVDAIDVGIVDKLFVAAVCFGVFGSADFFEELLRAVGGGGRGGCYDDVGDVVDAAAGWGGVEVAGEGFCDAARGEDALEEWLTESMERKVC